MRGRSRSIWTPSNETSNLHLAEAPCNVPLPAIATGLARDSVVNVSQVLTLDRGYLTEYAGTLPARLQRSVDEGLRIVLSFKSGRRFLTAANI